MARTKATALLNSVSPMRYRLTACCGLILFIPPANGFRRAQFEFLQSDSHWPQIESGKWRGSDCVTRAATTGKGRQPGGAIEGVSLRVCSGWFNRGANRPRRGRVTRCSEFRWALRRSGTTFHDRFGHAGYFYSIDLKSGNRHIQVNERDA